MFLSVLCAQRLLGPSAAPQICGLVDFGVARVGTPRDAVGCHPSPPNFEEWFGRHGSSMARCKDGAGPIRSSCIRTCTISNIEELQNRGLDAVSWILSARIMPIMPFMRRPLLAVERVVGLNLGDSGWLAAEYYPRVCETTLLVVIRASRATNNRNALALCEKPHAHVVTSQVNNELTYEGKEVGISGPVLVAVPMWHLMRHRLHMYRK